MNKEEILSKSRSEKNDEGLTAAENKGRSFGYITFIAVFTFVIIFNLFHGQNSYAPMSMFWAFIAAESYPKYIFTKQKSYLLSTIFGAIASIGFLINFVLVS